MFKTDQELYITIVLGALLFTGLSTIVVLVIWNFKKRQQRHMKEIEAMQSEFEQQLLLSQIEVQESAYRHIAKELHDNVGQLLSTAKMLMSITELKLSHAPDTLLTANATLSSAIQELRMLSRSLDKEWLEQFDFLENLHIEIDRIKSSGTIAASIDCNTNITMDPEGQIILFRIVQEAIQNAIRHAKPSCIHIAIHNRLHLEVNVTNDGLPLPPNFHGMGTRNMQQRAQLFGGKVNWQTGAEGTVVTISLPLNQRHEN